ncbi:hypothetical protein [Kosakonia cowanii]|jgi:hypothetical protein|nr:hypothetical protein [Kosakonia cowanii]
MVAKLALKNNKPHRFAILLRDSRLFLAPLAGVKSEKHFFIE